MSNENNNENVILSKVLPDNTIIETIYNKETGKTDFVIGNNDSYRIENSLLTRNNLVLQPFWSNSDLITSNFLRLPTGIEEYETNEKLFFEIKSYIDKYVKLPSDFSTVSALYIIMSWVYDRFDTIPYLRVIGNYGTGKTRFLNVIGNLCYKGMMAGGSITTAATFRTLDQIQGTLVFDEADFRNSELWSEIIKILNSGHTKNFPVIRMSVVNKKDGFETKSFKVYGPKILASREKFGDEALESRSLTQIMFPISQHDKPIHYNNEDAEANKLKNKLLLFRLRNYSKIEADEDTVKELEFPRLKQSALAIATIAKFIGIPEIIIETNDFLKDYERELIITQQHDPKADVVLTIELMIKSSTEPDKLRIGDISQRFSAEYYNEFSDRHTKYYETKNDVLEIPAYFVSPRKIGSIIKKLGIRTERDGNGFYIPIPQELDKIHSLSKRYGLEDLIKNKLEKGDYDREHDDWRFRDE